MNKEAQILSVAASLMSKKGFAGTSFQDIADKVGLHKSTLFHYYKNKEELLLSILETSIDEVSDRLQEIVADNQIGPEDKLRLAIDNHVGTLIKYLDNVNVFLNELRCLSEGHRAIYLEKRKKYQVAFQKIVMEMKKKKYFKGCDPKVTTLGLLGMMNWIPKWYRESGPLSKEEIVDVFCTIVAHCPARPQPQSHRQGFQIT
jgi:AcrR family transcriptional regulator